MSADLKPYSLPAAGGNTRPHRFGGVDGQFLIVALFGAALAHFAADFARERLPYWGVASTVYAAVVLGCWRVLHRPRIAESGFETPAARRDRIEAMSLIEAAREARRLVANETLFQHTPAMESSPPILEGIPESIRRFLEQTEKIASIDGSVTLSRQSLVMLPNRQMQIGRWPIDGGERSIQVNVATGEASLWFHDEEDDAEQETMPSVYHLIVLESP